MNETLKPRKPCRTHPIWRGLFCLILGFSAWVGVSRWLQPKSLWSKLVSEQDTIFWPLTEDENGKYLVAWESPSRPGPVLESNPVLAVLDQRTGAVLHSTPHHDQKLPISYFVPRIHQRVIWRVKDAESPTENVLELRSWHFEKDNAEKVVHRWRCPNYIYIHVDWSKNSQVLLIRYHFPPLLLMLAAEPNIMFKWLIYHAQTEGGFYASWYESWKIPESENGTATMLARWTVPWTRWQEYAELSPDGRYAAVTECLSTESNVIRKLSGQREVHGQQLLRAFTDPPYGTLLFDTATGKQQYHFQDPSMINNIKRVNIDIGIFELLDSNQLVIDCLQLNRMALQ